MKTPLAMATDLGRSPELIQGLTGMAIAALALDQFELLVQVPDGPSWYQALVALPSPPVDISNQLKKDNEALADGKKIKNFNVDKMWGLGTPEDLELFIRNYEGEV